MLLLLRNNRLHRLVKLRDYCRRYRLGVGKGRHGFGKCPGLTGTFSGGFVFKFDFKPFVYLVHNGRNFDNKKYKIKKENLKYLTIYSGRSSRCGTPTISPTIRTSRQVGRRVRNRSCRLCKSNILFYFIGVYTIIDMKKWVHSESRIPVLSFRIRTFQTC